MPHPVEFTYQILGQVAEVAVAPQRTVQATIGQHEAARDTHGVLLLATILAGEVVSLGDLDVPSIPSNACRLPHGEFDQMTENKIVSKLGLVAAGIRPPEGWHG
jgi:hypothetical protein